MKPNVRTWIFFSLSAIAGFLVWLWLTFPVLSNIDLSVNRHQALRIAQNYLSQERHIDISPYKSAIVFVSDRESDRYLQKTLHIRGEKKFFEKHDFELFFWVVRFFQPEQKEEYLLSISAASGEITAFRHTISDADARDFIDRPTAKEKGIRFLTDTFDFDPEKYFLKDDIAHDLDNRTDYSFSYQEKGVYIPWSQEKDTGGAKLITGTRISGEEILAFSKNNLEIPDQFKRFLSKQTNTGQNLLTLIYIGDIIIFMGAIFYVILRRNHLAMHVSKRFYIQLAVIMFLITMFSDLNEFEHILRSYPTTQPFQDYLIRFLIHSAIGAFFLSLGLILPGLAGESLAFEQFPQKKKISFLHYLQTTFLSRNVASLIGLGYLVFFILIGLQSIAFEFGQRYCGVWMEHTWVTQLSSTYWPFFAAFVIGFQASIFEEVIFRMFAISWIRKLTKNTFVAVILASLLWGFGHSGYLVFPMWFRGIEVTLMGILLSVVYLRFGLITVVVAHYLFDVFWSGIGYLFGKSEPIYFISTLAVLLLPACFAVIAFIKNKIIEEKPLRWRLNKHQEFNLNVIKMYLEQTSFIQKSREDLRKDLIAHGWDVAVTDIALEDLYGRGEGQKI